MRLYLVKPDGKHVSWRDVESLNHAMDWIIERYPDQSYSERNKDGLWRDHVNVTKTGDNTFTLDFDLMVDDNEEDILQYNFIVI